MVRRITDEDLEHRLCNEAGVIAVAFMCYKNVPCDHFRPELLGLEELMGDRIKFFQIDADENPSKCDELGIGAVPMLVVYLHAKEIARYEGPYSKEALKGRLETVLLMRKPDDV